MELTPRCRSCRVDQRNSGALEIGDLEFPSRARWITSSYSQKLAKLRLFAFLMLGTRSVRAVFLCQIDCDTEIDPVRFTRADVPSTVV